MVLGAVHCAGVTHFTVNSVFLHITVFLLILGVSLILVMCSFLARVSGQIHRA